uniref:uracil-DNA glycosylase family protein n=1 Tax=Klebsiella pneumoniae TaxID=573 RepID=UPI003B982197
RDAYVTCVVKCAPPDNKPAPDELERCGELHFADELAELKRVSVFLVLGQIALAGLWTRLHRGAQSHAPGARPPARPRFAHGAGVTLADNR